MGEGETRTSAGGSKRSLGCFLALFAACALLVNAASAAGPTKFVQEWGGFGAGAGQFNAPSGIAVDGAGNVYVIDAGNHRLQKFSESGVFLQQWSGDGTEAGEFSAPIGVAVDSAGFVYVLDRGSNRVQKYTGAGGFVDEWGSAGNVEDLLVNPEGIAVDVADRVYVVDTGNRRIIKYTNGGAFLQEWGTEGGSQGQFQAPRGIATDSFNNVYVADSGNDRVQKFSQSGVFLDEWGSTGSAQGQFELPSGLAVDAAGEVYVADSGNDRIQIFDGAGTLLAIWGSEGTGPGQFQLPVGVAPSDTGKVFIADAGNNRIQVIAPDLTEPAPVLPAGGLPAPVYGKSVNISLIRGVVNIKLPGTGKFVALTSAEAQVPVGTLIDARQGRLRLTAAKGPGGGTQTADFYSGIFRVLQPQGGKPVTVLKLQNQLVCGKTNHLMATASKKRGSGLWGSGKGSFRSEGRHGSATVRGTIWWAQDTCEGTFFKVRKGVVRIEDFSSDKTLKLRAGQQYLAPAD
jgi:DNA-binding beta-propeller fold protein YncE